MDLTNIEVKIKIIEFLKKFDLYNLYELDASDKNIFNSYYVEDEDKNSVNSSYNFTQNYSNNENPLNNIFKPIVPISLSRYLFIGTKNKDAYFLLYEPLFGLSFPALEILYNYKYKDNSFKSKKNVIENVWITHDTETSEIHHFTGTFKFNSDMNEFYYRMNYRQNGGL